MLTADNCCCGTCRDLGFYNYEEMREIVEAVDESMQVASNGAHGLASKKSLLTRIKKEEEFRRGSYQSHLENDSEVGAHCLRMLLSSINDRNFESCCTHPACGDATVAPMETMEQRIRRVERRNTQPRDWKDACEVTGKTATSIDANAAHTNTNTNTNRQHQHRH